MKISRVQELYFVQYLVKEIGTIRFCKLLKWQNAGTWTAKKKKKVFYFIENYLFYFDMKLLSKEIIKFEIYL